MFGIIPPSFYHTFFLLLFGILVFLEVNKLVENSNDQLLYGSNAKNGFNTSLLLSIFLIIFFGTRDPNSEYFADTLGYAGRYNSIKDFGESSVWYSIINSAHGETIWRKLMLYLATYRVDVSVWFTVIACLYILPILISVKRIFPRHIYLMCICAFLNFGFYGGAVNGIRNGAALSVVLLALSFVIAEKRKIIPALILFAIAAEIHTSSVLPSLCMLCAVYLIRKPKWSILIWFLSIFISLIYGNVISIFFADLGFDDRLSSYIDNADMGYVNGVLTHVGFRWDFLVFSAAPILWGWWVINKIRVRDTAYNIIFNTYVLANSFWVLVIRAAFSNRFAALSWFLYFLVLFYPLLKHNLYPKQGRTFALMLIGLYLVNIIL